MGVVQPTEQRSIFEEVAFELARLGFDFIEFVGLVLIVAAGAMATTWYLGLPYLVGVVALGVALVILVVVGGSPLIKLHRLGRVRRRRRNFYRKWPDFCDRLGWSERLSVHAGSERADEKPAQVPDLLLFQRDEYGAVLELKPLSSQPRDKWPKMADALARDRGYPHQRWSEPRPGVLRIELIASELPQRVEYSPALHDREAWDEIVVAVDASGQVVCWKPSEVPHMLVGGVTQGGKGSVLRQIMVHGLRTGWQFITINPKESGEFGWASALDVPVITDIETAARVVKWLLHEMKRRQRIVSAARVNNWMRLPDPSVIIPLGVVVDEGTSLLTPNKANKKMADMQLMIGDGLYRVTMQGRAVGLHVVIAAQRPDANNLGPSGGALRMNLDARVAVCNVDGDGRRMMFDGLDDPDILRTLDGTKGRAVLAKLQAGNIDAFPGQVVYADEEDLNDRPPRVKVTQLAAPSMPLVSAGTHLLDDGSVA